MVLLSGGVDSSTCLAIASQNHRCRALTVRYGQRNWRELESARLVAEGMRVAVHRVVDIPLGWIGGSALLDAGGHGTAIPVSPDGVSPSVPPADAYVPARNAIFLAMGAAWAEALGTPHLFIGVNRVDYSGYPDCRPAFVAAMEQALRLGTRSGDLEIHAPLMELTKGQIIRQGSDLGLDYSITFSCYDPRGDRACGLCDSCIHRKKGFAEAGVPDPTDYES